MPAKLLQQREVPVFPSDLQGETGVQSCLGRHSALPGGKSEKARLRQSCVLVRLGARYASAAARRAVNLDANQASSPGYRRSTRTLRRWIWGRDRYIVRSPYQRCLEVAVTRFVFVVLLFSAPALAAPPAHSKAGGLPMCEAELEMTLEELETAYQQIEALAATKTAALVVGDLRFEFEANGSALSFSVTGGPDGALIGLWKFDDLAGQDSSGLMNGFVTQGSSKGYGLAIGDYTFDFEHNGGEVTLVAKKAYPKTPKATEKARIIFQIAE